MLTRPQASALGFVACVLLGACSEQDSRVIPEPPGIPRIDPTFPVPDMARSCNFVMPVCDVHALNRQPCFGTRDQTCSNDNCSDPGTCLCWQGQWYCQAGEEVPTPDACGDPATDPACIEFPNGPPEAPFPLLKDPTLDPEERDQGLRRNEKGYLILDGAHATGSYSMLLDGCRDGDNTVAPGGEWYLVVWDADIPPLTSITVHARSGNVSDTADSSWGAWTRAFPESPIDLQQELHPNNGPYETGSLDGYLQVEFVFTTADPAASPTLKSFDIGLKCYNPGP